MKLLLDMNLSPRLASAFGRRSVECVHWSRVGPYDATDEQIMAWAVWTGHIVFTHDLDFSAILASTHARGPSVIQWRAADLLDDQIVEVVTGVLTQHARVLDAGALIVIDPHRQRLRVLPLRQPPDVSS